MYSGLTAIVKWEGEVSPSFCVLQRVRRGGILATPFYKTYLNDFLIELESRAVGKFISSLYLGCPTVADDLLCMPFSDCELQLMFRSAYINSQEKSYTNIIIHSQKSTAQQRNATKRLLKSGTSKDHSRARTCCSVLAAGAGWGEKLYFSLIYDVVLFLGDRSI